MVVVGGAATSELDYACGAYCIVTAAIALSILKDDGDVLRNVLRALQGTEPRTLGSVAMKAFDLGLGKSQLGVLARAAGLRLQRVNRPSLSKLDSGLHIVLVRASFVDPMRMVESYEGLHYVLVLEANQAEVIVADSHP